MPEKDIIHLIKDESFLNYCFQRNEADIVHWEDWIEKNPDKSLQVAELRNLVTKFSHNIALLEVDQQFLLLQNQIKSNAAEINTKAVIRPLWQKITVAASVLLVLTAGILFYVQSNRQQQPLKTTRVLKKDVDPGGNKAILTLADGTKIVLDNTENGTIASQGSTAINKTKNGQLVYDASINPLSSTSDNQPVSYNTIVTPPGGQYQVILPDGTQVWLNAASSLRFPTAFSEQNRMVELTGEGYFEVAKDAGKKFIVEANGTKVEVLGTHFNVMAYADESSINTTLLEGSVKVIKGNESKIIIPGQQARVKENIHVAIADINEAVAWKNGYFIFKNEDLQSIMRKISRWYDVEIKYEGQIPRESFGGKISRYKNVSEVLRLLELTGPVQFKIENYGEKQGDGRRIIVMN